MHSGTKFIGGHTDLISGIVCTNNKEIHDQVRFNLIAVGGCLTSFDAYLFCRSLKTLKLRVEEASFNASIINDFLSSHPAVEKIYYPFNS